MRYSQNLEDIIVANYFGDNVGTLLDLGANDGTTFSNSRYLIEKGWSAHLVEPSSLCSNIIDLHIGNPRVNVHNCAIDTEDYMGTLYESGAHVPHGTDRALVSTLSKDEMKRWPNVSFKQIDCACVCFETFYNHIERPKLDFISIDCEAKDWQILQQINLHEVGCSCLCVEWNSIPILALQYSNYCAQYGLKEIHRNGENIIFAV